MKENEEKKKETPKKRYFFEVAITRYRDCPVFAKSLEETREIAEQWAEYEYGGWDYKVDFVTDDPKRYPCCDDEDCWTKEKVDALDDEDWALDDEE